MSIEPFVGMDEAHLFLKVKKSWLYEQVRLGRVPVHKVGVFNRFKLSELDAWARGTLVGQQGVSGNDA